LITIAIRPLARSGAWSLVALVALSACGCQTFPLAGFRPALRNRVLEGQLPAHGYVPKELDKVNLPTYVIEPPDILLIDAVKVVPKSPYKIEALDILQIVVEGTLEGPNQEIFGPYAVDPGGNVDLGPSYGALKLAGLTLEEARAAIRAHLEKILREPEVSVTLAESAGKQQISGEHLVGPDGMINLGTYGSVKITNLTLAEAKQAIEKHLEEFLEEPEVSVDVFAFNSKVYYIITEGAGLGDQVARVPCTGNETVLDAISQVNGLSRVSSKTIWIARPAPDGVGCDQVLPVNWRDIVRGGSTETNYQVLPGDRVLIAENRLVAFDTAIDQLISPFERIFGFTLLGTQTIQTMNRFPQGLQNQNQFF
jgi:polysaccharide biosynthesis/export protein